MELYYEPKKQKWHHNLSDTAFVIGKNNVEIRFHPYSDDLLRFHVKKINKKAGPIIGILTKKGKQKSFVGNLPLFKRISSFVQEHGGVVIVFTAENIEKDHIQGYTYHPDTGSWYEVTTPLPDVIYNRIPGRKTEESGTVQNAMKHIYELNIPIFNPHFFNKNDFNKVICSEKQLSTFVPETIKFTHISQLDNMISKYKGAYIKLANGHKGKGIFYVYKGVNGFHVKSAFESKHYSSLQHFWKENKQQFLHDDYVVQQWISLKKYNDRCYDFRVLAYYVHKEWQVAGIGVRQAKQDAITTHVPSGGSLLHLDNVSTEQEIEKIKKIVSLLGTTLRNAYGNIREISIDIGISETNHFYIFEANAKPMVFDEVSIKKKGLQLLCECLYEQSDFL